MRWVANMMPAGTTQAARAKSRAAGPAGKINLTGLPTSSAHNCSSQFVPGIFPGNADGNYGGYQKAQFTRIIFGGLTPITIPDPFKEGVTWRLSAAAYPYFGTRGDYNQNGVVWYDAPIGQVVDKKQDSPGGMVIIGAVSDAKTGLDRIYEQSPDNVKALLAAIQAKLPELFEGLPFDVLLDRGGGYLVNGKEPGNGGGGGGLGAGCQIRRPTWLRTIGLGGSGGDDGGGGSGDEWHFASGGEGWRAYFNDYFNENASDDNYNGEINANSVTASCSLLYPLNARDVRGDGWLYNRDIKGHFDAWATSFSFNFYPWNYLTPRTIPGAAKGIGIYIGPYQAERPAYVAARLSQPPIYPGPAYDYVPGIYPFASVSWGGPYMMSWDFPITAEHMDAICRSGRYALSQLAGANIGAGVIFCEHVTAGFDAGIADIATWGWDYL